MTAMPGAMPSAVPSMKSRKLSLLAPATILTIENGAIGTIRIMATATTPLPMTRL